MNEEKEKIILDKEDYEEILEELKRLEARDDLDDNYEWILFSSSFWDNFFTKIISNFVSVKVWILIFVLYVPYQLLMLGKISADNYTSLLIVIAPVVVGLREFSKTKQVENNKNRGGIIDKVKSLFKI